MRAIMLAALAATSCATPYQANGFRGGYEDTNLGAGRWLITVHVNAYTSRATAVQYTYRRAAELCPYGFDPVDSTSETTYHTANFGNGPQEYSKANAVLVVQCR